MNRLLKRKAWSGIRFYSLDAKRNHFYIFSEAHYDYIGLWEVVCKVRALDSAQSPDDVKSRTLTLVAEMLASGFLVVDLLPLGRCQPWGDQNISKVLDRIDTEWRALGQEPNIGDVAWFTIKENLNKPALKPI